MVATGARVRELARLLQDAGLTLIAPPPAPRLPALSAESSAAILDLYRRFGGIADTPRLTPGAWDLAGDDGLLIELDEDFHFTRYREATLDLPGAQLLPWTSGYRRFCAEHERIAGGGRWTNPSAERLFGPADPVGAFDGAGSPRGKQRALYDAMKDMLGATGAVRLARVSIWDEVGDVALDEILYRRAAADPGAVHALVEARTSGATFLDDRTPAGATTDAASGE